MRSPLIPALPVVPAAIALPLSLLALAAVALAGLAALPPGAALPVAPSLALALAALTLAVLTFPAQIALALAVALPLFPAGPFAPVLAGAVRPGRPFPSGAVLLPVRRAALPCAVRGRLVPPAGLRAFRYAGLSGRGGRGVKPADLGQRIFL